MRKLLLLILLLVSTFHGFSQTEGISYQAVILNPQAQEIPGVNVQGNILANTPISIQFTVVNASGTEEYQEQHSLTTDRYGMVNLLIGTGTAKEDTVFTNILWDGTKKILKVEIDFSAGINFSPLSEQNLTYLPHPPTAEVTAEIAEITNNIIEEEIRAMVAEEANAAAITNEEARAIEAEEANNKAITDEETRAKDAEQVNATAISDEETRAKDAEQVNATAIRIEEARAKDAEQANATAITDEEARAIEAEEANNKAITDEETRAKDAEQVNATAITDEETRAKDAEQVNATAITDEETRAKDAEQVNATAIRIEEARAKDAEQANATAITDEEARAKDAEQANATAITDEETRAKDAEQANATAISNEETRAKDAEQANTAAISNEETRAKNAEQVNATAIRIEEARAKDAEQANATAITDEEARAKDAEQANATAITDEETRAKDAEQANATAISNEEARAKDAEQTNATAITDEETRAKNAEQANVAAISDEETRAKDAEQANATAISNEEARAKDAEQTNATAITDEEERAKNAEQANVAAISDEETRAKDAEQANATAISNEEARAKDAEQANATAITDEETRAKDAEQVNATAIRIEEARAKDAEQTNAAAISDEETRAKDAEQANATAISNEEARAKDAEQANTAAISNEEARAKDAEQVNATAIRIEEARAKDAEQVNATAIRIEEARAKDAEQTNATAISNEETRAKDAEQANATAITDEETRAKNAEQANATAITDEETRAKNAEQVNATAIRIEEARAKDAEQVNATAIRIEEARAKDAEQTNAAAISDEETRAKEAEQTNATAITDEEERARNAEQANTAAISNEEARAKDAEQVNATAISNEETRAKDAEQANATAITDEEERARNAEQANVAAISEETVRAGLAEVANAENILILKDEQNLQNTAIDLKADKNNPIFTGNATIGADLNVGGNMAVNGGLFLNSWDIYTSNSTFSINESGVASSFNIIPGGNVGIGNLSPQFNLDVTGQINATKGLYLRGNKIINNDGFGRVEFFDNTGIEHIELNEFVTNIQTVDVLIQKRLGIGVISPTADLEVAGTVKFVDGTQGSGKILTSDTDGLASWQVPNTDAITTEETRAMVAEQRNATAISEETIRAGLAEVANATNISAHSTSIDNPHRVTQAQVGLGNVTNTSDADKAISALTQRALDANATVISNEETRASGAEGVNAANIAMNVRNIETNFTNIVTNETNISTNTSGIETNISKIYNNTSVTSVNNNLIYLNERSISDNSNSIYQEYYRATAAEQMNAAAIAENTAKTGITSVQASDITTNTTKVGVTSSQASAITANTAKISYNNTASTKLATIEEGAEVNAVGSVAGRTGAVSLVKGDVGLNNVTNTSDADKPVSTLTQTALDGKVDNSQVLTDVPAGAVFKDTQLDAAGVTALGFKSGPHTVNTNTQLTEAQVVAYVGNIGYLTTHQDLTGLEPIINTKKSAFNKDFGIVAGTVLEGNTITISTQQTSDISVNNAKITYPGDQDLTGLETRITALEPLAPPALGDYRDGGVVFWLDASGEHGLVCTVNDMGALAWDVGPFVATGANGTAIGTGKSNTDQIVSIQASSGKTNLGYAAQKADSYEGGNYTDWFLPSIDELTMMLVTRKDEINSGSLNNGGTILDDNNFYWSSTEEAYNFAANKRTDGASATDGWKHDGLKVRFIRAFTQTLTAGDTNAAAISAHSASTKNPHGVTQAQVGLGNVANTSDADKPVSHLTQTALDRKVDQESFILELSGLTATAVFLGDNLALVENNKEDLVNKSNNIYTDRASDTKYPTVKSVKTYVDEKVLATTGNFMDLTTDQTIEGTKIFSSNIKVGALEIRVPLNQSTLIGKDITQTNRYPSNTTAVGFMTLNTNTGKDNTAIGTNAMRSSGNASYTTTIGSEAGSSQNPIPGDYNSFVGYKSGMKYSAAVINNSTAIGNGALVDDSNTIQLGNTSIYTVKTSGTYTAGAVTYINTDGTNGQVLTTNGSGATYWATSAVNVTEVDDEFTATTSQTAFTLSQAPSANSKVKMYVNGIRISKTAYTYSSSGTSLTYDPATNGGYQLTAGDRIQFDFFY